MTLKADFKGRLIAIGGNEDRVDEQIVLKRVVSEIGKKDFSVAVITTASEEPIQRGKEYHKVFKSLGAQSVEILSMQKRKEANDATIAHLLDKVDLTFISGGDQLRLTTIIGGSKVLDSLHRRLNNGGLIAGTSAGAAVFSDTMIYEGKSEEGLLKGKVYTRAGFGFVENIVFDTHFMTRGRIGRLVQVVTTNPTCIGVGIGDDSAVILNGDGTMEVIGSGQVIIVDGSMIRHSNIMEIKKGGAIAVENIRVHSLVHNYRYAFKNRKFLTPKTKQKATKK